MKMIRDKLNKIKGRPLIIAGLLFCFIVLNCGDEPAGPVDNGWVAVAVFPITGDSGVNAINTRGGPVRAVTYENFFGKDRRVAKIIAYDDRAFHLEYESGAAYERAELADIAFARNSNNGWAVGDKREGQGNFNPLMLYYGNDNQSWEEIEVAGFNGYTFSRVISINETDVWLLIDDDYRPGEHDGLLAKYADGNLRVYEDIGPVTAVLPYTRHSPLTLYAVSYAAFGYPPGELPKVYISADAGGSWAVETFPENLMQGREINRAYAGAGFGPDLYILAKCRNDAWAVIRRTGPPGAGEYTIAFLAHRGPYLSGFNSIGFRDAHSPPRGISADGVAVGRETSVMFDDGKVYLEKLPYGLDLTCVIPYGGNGFFAVGKNEAFGGHELLYHP